MRSASPRSLADLKAEFDREVLWSRVRASLGEGHLVAFVIVVALTLSIANSTATAQWVSGIGVITGVAIAGAIALGVLAILPVPWAGGLGLGIVAGPVIAFAVSWPALHAAHPTDPLDYRLIGIWFGRISDGTAASDTSFYLFLICWLMWVTGAWLSWCVLRWRKPLLGLIPGAAAFATNVLNITPGSSDQNGYTLAMLVFTLALLLWSNYTASIANATHVRVKMTGDAKWDFWESGLIAMAGLIVLSILLPPLSTVDKTVDVESSMFSSWAQLQQRLNHAGPFNAGPGGAGTTGFSTDVHLGQALTRTRDIVFEYTFVGDPGTRYFRGVDVTATVNGEWRYAGSGFKETIVKNQEPLYAEDYSALALSQFNVKMVRPPIGNADILFYPSQLLKIDRQTLASQVPLTQQADSLQLMTIDRLSSLQPSTSAGGYSATVEYSTAGIAQLQSAGTNYPDWVQPYTTLGAEYRPPDVMAAIHQRALDVVRAAGFDPATATPYDMASAIEAYLRSNAFAYTLTPPTKPDGMDDMDWFLFKSPSPHAGYCEYFATAMGDMLRSLGIPTRLVNGFGPGTFDSQVEAYVVRGEDAHTWVEVYFPTYGWIPFEPTNDNVYTTITRGAPAGACLRDENCSAPTSGGGGFTSGPGGQVTPHTGGRNEPATVGGGGVIQVSGFRINTNDLTKAAAVVVAIVLLLLAVIARYLRPRTVMAVWRRTLALSRLAGAQRRPAETPLELGRRLQRTFPEAAESVSTLANGFVVAAYAPPDIASSTRASVMEAWVALRPVLLRRILARFRPGRME